jgi:hypothetical protein
MFNFGISHEGKNKGKHSDFLPCSDYHNSHFNAYFQHISDVYNFQSISIFLLKINLLKCKLHMINVIYLSDQCDIF